MEYCWAALPRSLEISKWKTTVEGSVSPAARIDPRGQRSTEQLGGRSDIVDRNIRTEAKKKKILREPVTYIEERQRAEFAKSFVLDSKAIGA